MNYIDWDRADEDNIESKAQKERMDSLRELRDSFPQQYEVEQDLFYKHSYSR